MSSQQLSLLEALSHIAGKPFYQLPGEEQNKTLNWLSELARSGAVRMRGNMGPGAENKPISSSRFFVEHSFDVPENAVVWIGGPDVRDFEGAEIAGTSDGWSPPADLLPGVIHHGYFDAQGRLKSVRWRAVVRLVTVEAVALETNLLKQAPQHPVRNTRPKNAAQPEAVADLATKLWPDGTPASLSAKLRNSRLRDEGKHLGLAKVSDSTITRGLRLYWARQKKS